MPDRITEPQEPTPAQQAAAIVLRSGQSDYAGLTVPRSHRFRLHSHDRILALAEAAGVPFAHMLEEVIASGLHAIEQALGPEQLEKIEYNRIRSLGSAMKGRKKASDIPSA